MSYRGQGLPGACPVPCFSTWSSPRDASLLSFGSQRAWFPALAGTMKALRLPTCASAVAYFVHFRRPRDPSWVCVRHCARGAVALLEGRRSPPGPGSWMPATRAVPAHSRGRQWDLSGLQVIHPVSLLRSWTPVEPMCPCLGGHIGAAPTSGTVKASDDKHFGAQSRSFDTCSPTLRVSCCHSRARLASGWLAFTGRASNPLDHYERFQITWSSPFPVLLTLDSCRSSRMTATAESGQERPSGAPVSARPVTR